MDVTKPKLVTLRVRGDHTDGLRSVVHVRHFELAMDEPEALGGTDTGPNPMEYVLGSLAGCAAVMLRIIAGEQGLTYTGADFDLRGILDLRGLEGVAGVSPHFQKVAGTIRVQTADAGKLATVASAVERRCPVFNLLKDAGTVLEVQWQATGR